MSTHLAESWDAATSSCCGVPLEQLEARGDRVTVRYAAEVDCSGRVIEQATLHSVSLVESPPLPGLLVQLVRAAWRGGR